MIIRPAKRSDLPTILLITEQFHDEDPAYNLLPFDPDKALRTLEQFALTRPKCLFVAEVDEKIVGFFMGLVAVSNFGEFNEAYEEYFYVLPDYRGSGAGLELLNAYKEWAKAKCCVLVHAQVLSQINQEASVKMMEKAGFHLMGSSWVFGG